MPVSPPHLYRGTVPGSPPHLYRGTDHRHTCTGDSAGVTATPGTVPGSPPHARCWGTVPGSRPHPRGGASAGASPVGHSAGQPRWFPAAHGAVAAVAAPSRPDLRLPPRRRRARQPPAFPSSILDSAPRPRAPSPPRNSARRSRRGML
ncbi:sterile alpha motif domain-containing protein 1-like [Ammospiza caudacuta]|uniref:sterile alpha motif domain-containing protein 1-like n=1 Tax=Ammospiza caudacuta TaxID=2857398 RepID=UPI00273884A5|nr:sterile alpha motif domain-containing protein 1-like [Ammospiza caudacuta]